MFSMFMGALDATIDFALTTFKKVLWTVVIAAVVASIVTATIIILGYNIVL